MFEKINEAAEFLRKEINITPEIGIVLGSGLGGLVDDVEIIHSIEYNSIPHFSVSTVKGHSGKLIFGKLGNKNVVVMQGRLHYYEGYSMQEITFPLRVLIALGIKRIILSNASGGMNPEYERGDLVIITDHINLMPSNPLIGKNYDELGPRFPDMSEAYDPEMIKLGIKIAKENNIRLHPGVYVAVSGPCFETPAEYRYLRTIGADIVGMSTVPEVIVARHAGIPCFAISIVTDLGGFETQKVSHQEVLDVANRSAGKVRVVISELVAKV